MSQLGRLKKSIYCRQNVVPPIYRAFALVYSDVLVVMNNKSINFRLHTIGLTRYIKGRRTEIQFFVRHVRFFWRFKYSLRYQGFRSPLLEYFNKELLKPVPGNLV